MAHKIYENFVLENKIEDMLDTQLALSQFCTVDNSLTENAGMKKIIHKYTATGDVQDLAMGEGNSQDIEVTFSDEEYEVGTTQGRFKYYDEQEMTDPMVIDTGLAGISAKMTNDLTSKIIAEYGKATLTYNAASTGLTFDAIVDAIAKYPYESEGGLFLLINMTDKAKLRKALGDELKYVEDFARTGYIGTVCGVPVYVSKAVPANTAYLATKEAVTLFYKKGSEIEQERDANIRENKVYARKVMLVALTDDTRVIKITTGTTVVNP